MVSKVVSERKHLSKGLKEAKDRTLSKSVARALQEKGRGSAKALRYSEAYVKKTQEARMARVEGARGRELEAQSGKRSTD